MIIEYINRIIGASVSALLITVGLYFFVKLRCFWLFHPIKLLKSMFSRHEGNGISPFRAVTVALAGTLGVGNIVGVAGAVTLGGFGAVFWMWVSALCAMVLKYAEIALAVSHRRKSSDGSPYGGAVYYIRDYFAKKHDRTGAVIAGVFSVLLLLDSFTTGCVVQINAAARSLSGVCRLPVAVFGIAAAGFTLFVVLSGAKGVSRLTGWLIPMLSIGYILLSVVVMVMKFDRVPAAFAVIFDDAFSFDSTVGGIFGFLTCRALRFGTMRGLLSNEAGCGTAPTAHASADAKSPAEQGFWGIFEVFVDTIVLCTLTAIVIILNYDIAAEFYGDGIIMAIRAYSATLGGWSEYFLAGSVAVFGLATVICWAHYGRECILYLFRRKAKIMSLLYLLVYAGVTVYGACAAPNSVWGAADFAIGSMTLLNLAVLLLMRREVKDLTTDFFGKCKNESAAAQLLQQKRGSPKK